VARAAGPLDNILVEGKESERQGEGKEIPATEGDGCP